MSAFGSQQATIKNPEYQYFTPLDTKTDICKLRQMKQCFCDVVVEPDREKKQSSTGGLNSIRAKNLLEKKSFMLKFYFLFILPAMRQYTA